MLFTTLACGTYEGDNLAEKPQFATTYSGQEVSLTYVRSDILGGVRDQVMMDTRGNVVKTRDSWCVASCSDTSIQSTDTLFNISAAAVSTYRRQVVEANVGPLQSAWGDSAGCAVAETLTVEIDASRKVFSITCAAELPANLETVRQLAQRLARMQAD